MTLAALGIALVATFPGTPMHFLLALAAPATSSTAAPTTTSTVGIQTPAPTDVPTGALPEAITRVPTTDPVVFVTIDDGYQRDPAVLDKIRQARVPVSLFLVEPEARAGIGFFADLVAAGATVQNHALAHPDLRSLSAGGQAAEICGWTSLGPRLFGSAPTLFRPPFGFYDGNVRQVAAGCGFDHGALAGHRQRRRAAHPGRPGAPPPR